uniref:Protein DETOXIFICATION n=1 Tax=Leersia perrieri TaxID=77586 RepID=A0A0D9XW21_9ORYZ
MHVRQIAIPSHHTLAIATGMAATSPPMRSVAVAAAAALLLIPSPTLNRISFPSSRRRCPSASALRWRPARCRGKPAVTDVVDEEDEERETSPDAKLDDVRGWFVLDEIGMDIVSIALPAALALAADPITALIDTAFVGHIGSAQLAAVGVSLSIFNLVSKLLNVPLLNVTTSFVAEQQALDADYTSAAERDGISSPQEKSGDQRKFLPAVSTSLALAAGIGLMEMMALILGSGTLIDIVGIPTDSPMRVPAEQFLTLRAYGAPPVIVALAAQGAFRGFKDTRTPLFAVVAGNLVNALLDAIFIFPLGLGVSGAALATVASEYLTAFILLWKLNSQIVLFSWNIVAGDIIRYLKSGALLIARTIAVVLTFTVSTSLAAREGSVPMAGYEICLQVWLTISLLNDALALAGQALLASEYAKGNYKKARIVLYRVLQLFAGTVSSAVLLVAAPKFGLGGIWAGLTLFMSLRAIAGFWRIGSKGGPWKTIWSETEGDRSSRRKTTTRLERNRRRKRKKMPCLNVSTNVNLDGVDTSAVLADASKTVADIIGKPENYVMVVLKGSVPMAFGGTQDPAAYGELVSIGGLNPDVNKKLSAAIASILESKLSVPKKRFYLKFYDSKVCSSHFLLTVHSWVFFAM